MMLISGYKVSFAYSEKVILKETDFTIEEYDRIGLVGPNDVGKIKLLEIITGYQNCNRGKIVKGKKATSKLSKTSDEK